MERRFPPRCNLFCAKLMFDSGHNPLAACVHPRSKMRHAKFLLLIPAVLAISVSARTTYVGASGGIATLSADAGSRGTAQGLSLSSYAPANGGALNVFAGVHLHNYFSVQVNYIWNENDLILNSSSSSTGAFYQESRSSSQNSGIFDFLIYFRRRSSRVRPYLGTGVGVVHLASTREKLIASSGAPSLSPLTFTSTGLVFRSHVGIDLRLARKLDFRYSFSEMIGQNEISKHLAPPAPRGLENFQNLFGFVVRF